MYAVFPQKRGNVTAHGLVEVLVWAVVAYLLATNSEALIVLVLGLLYGGVTAAPASVLQNLIYVSPVFPLILGLLAVVRLKLAGENVWTATGLFAKTLPGDAVLGAFAGIACIGVAATSLQIAARYLDLPPMRTMPPQVHLYFMTIGAVVPGICEELYFRGMMMRVANGLAAPVVLVLTSAAFSIWHVGDAGLLAAHILAGPDLRGSNRGHGAPCACDHRSHCRERRHGPAVSLRVQCR